MPEFPSGFMMTIVGARRSGKSTLMKKLLNTTLKKMFRENDVFVLCPTIDLNDDFDEFPHARKYAKPDPMLIQAVMDEQKYNIQTFGKKRTPEVLIIFDDCADNNILRFGGILDTLAVRGRHFKISVIVSSQRMSAVSRTARLNSDYFVMFSPFNFSEAEQFMEQYVSKHKRKQFSELLMNIWDEPFNFIVIDNTERSQTRKIKKGFDEIIGISELPPLPKAKTSGFEKKPKKPKSNVLKQDDELN